MGRNVTRLAVGLRARLAAGLLAAGLLALPAARGFASPVPGSFWAARLWLTSQAFGLEEDCPVGVLFQDPEFRSTPIDGGGAATSRLVSQDLRGGDLYLVIETLRAGVPVERVTLQLRNHSASGSVASVESITLAGPADTDPHTIRYSDAVEDDEEYDSYTDTLASLYKTFFDEKVVRARAVR